mmetsp:Transcript_1470/g.4065  ORF Transcript_1470/g.4065 Transcript_1470/m.4065 type:complete len:360 (-) Transcript_1470:124-1203(-)
MHNSILYTPLNNYSLISETRLRCQLPYNMFQIDRLFIRACRHSEFVFQILADTSNVGKADHGNDRLDAVIHRLRVDGARHDDISLVQEGLDECRHLPLQPLKEAFTELRIRLDLFDDSLRPLRLAFYRIQIRALHLQTVLQLGYLLLIRTAKCVEGLSRRRAGVLHHQLRRSADGLDGFAVAKHNALHCPHRLGSVDGRHEFPAGSFRIVQVGGHVVVHARQKFAGDRREAIQQQILGDVLRQQRFEPRSIFLVGGVSGYPHSQFLGRHDGQSNIAGGLVSNPRQAGRIQFDHDHIGSRGFDGALDFLVGCLGEMRGAHQRDLGTEVWQVQNLDRALALVQRRLRRLAASKQRCGCRWQ